MFEKMERALEKIDADYADIRYEIKKETSISFGGRELTEIGSNSTDGFVIRVLKNGGMASIAFTDERDADKAIYTALENALLTARFVDPPVRLAEVEVIRDNFIPVLDENPADISLDEKLELVRRYNSIPLSHAKITTTSLRYSDVYREKYFLSSEGARIRENLITTGISGEIIAGGGALVQNVRVGIGGSHGFTAIRDRDDHFEKRTAIAVDLLTAKPVSGGTYNCIFNPRMTGVFAHEAFGHFSEADMLENLPAMREKMRIGEELGSDVLNIIDDPTSPDQLGFYTYDDEGVRVRPVRLMKNGVLTGRLHSRRTAALFGEPVTGHCVAEDYRFPPVVRMGTIFIQPGESSCEDLLNMLGEGLFILDVKGGSTTGENFSFGAQYGYLVKGGKIGRMVRDITVAGNLYRTLREVIAVGDKISLSETGGCIKGPIAQTNIRSCHGGPHILVNGMVIGGA
jgi:TldD protein